MTRPTTDSARPGLHRLDRAHRRLVGALDQQPVLLGDVAGQERRVGVAVHAVDVGGDVDVDDVAVLDHRRVRDAVADDLVQRRAARLREALVAQRRRVGAVVDHVLVGDAVEFVGGDARRDGLAGLGERARRDAAGDAHLLDHLGGLHPRLGALLCTVALPTYSGRAIELGHRQGRRQHAGAKCGANRHDTRVVGDAATFLAMTIDDVDEAFADPRSPSSSPTPGAPPTWPSTKRCGATTSC